MNRRLESASAFLLRRLDPERAHAAAVMLLRHVPLPVPEPDPPQLSVRAFGLTFPNPVGLAAGFDKDAAASHAMPALGFGFAEVGTLTPTPQPGNPRPRVFRLLADGAVINRYGFNGAGHVLAHRRLSARRGPGIIGVNIGANKDTADRIADYVAGITRFADVADYFALNVSSPNTPGLRDLQAEAALDTLLARCIAARDGLSARHGRKPVLLKIAPDLRPTDLDAIVAVARRRKADGMIVANTTVARPPGLRDPAAAEPGGLSGRPLFAPSTRVLAEAYLRVEQAFPLIGVGGVDSPAAAWAKIRAGASLIQLYSGLIYAGPGLVADIKRGLAADLTRRGTSLADEVGIDARSWAAGEQSPPFHDAHAPHRLETAPVAVARKDERLASTAALGQHGQPSANPPGS